MRDDFRREVAKPASYRLCQQISWKALNWRGSCFHPSSPLVVLVDIILFRISVNVGSSRCYRVRRKVISRGFSRHVIGCRNRLLRCKSTFHERKYPSGFMIALALSQEHFFRFYRGKKVRKFGGGQDKLLPMTTVALA